MPDLIYVYCVMDRAPVLEHVAVPEAKPASPLAELPDLLVRDGLYAVVGRVPAEDFSEENLPVRLKDVEWITRRLMLHERVVENAMQYGCVIPFKFGTVYHTEENVHLMLDAHATEFRQNLSELAGKQEWGVKIYCDRRQLTASVAAQNPTLVDLDREIGAATKGRAFLLTQRRAKLVTATVNDEVARFGQECFDRLAGQGLRARVNDSLPPEAGGESEEMILNAAFLVAKEKTPQFLDTADQLQQQLVPNGLRLKSTGPWPPYNFCRFSMESA